MFHMHMLSSPFRVSLHWPLSSCLSGVVSTNTHNLQEMMLYTQRIPIYMTSHSVTVYSAPRHMDPHECWHE